MLLAGLMVSTEAIEAMCALAREAGALGAKLTGSGGGGSVIALLPSRSAKAKPNRLKRSVFSRRGAAPATTASSPTSQPARRRHERARCDRDRDRPPEHRARKIWGKRDDGANLPAVPSLSVTLAGMATRTSVTFDPALARDELVLGGEPASEGARLRASGMLERVRKASGTTDHARVVSDNDFPTASGLASSASAFAALALASSAAAGI